MGKKKIFEWESFSRRKKVIWTIFIPTILIVGILFMIFGGGDLNKKTIAVRSLSIFEKLSQLLPIEKDTKKEVETINELVKELAKEDGVERRYLFLLQNNMELRPGGGFLGQYAVVKVKDGQVSDLFFEDANLLDQRITARVPAPYPFKKMMSIKKWKFRDSNFSPDFYANVEKAKHFYRLAGGNDDFDGVIAVNAVVLENVLDLTGPISIGGVEYNNENAVLKLEEVVEKAYLFNEDLNTQNRKGVMKKMAPIIVERLFKLQNVPKVAELVLKELRNKNIMINLEDKNLQELAATVHWDGAVAQNWEGDYLMLVDANMGALKSDYYIDREIVYRVDLTTEKPMVTLEYTYAHKATHGDWRTSDYHSYLRVYVPKRSNLIERKMVSYPNIQEDLGKTYFGFIAHTLIGKQTKALIKYELPVEVKKNYRLLIQKQSGMGDVPITVVIKTDEKEYEQKTVLKKDAKFELK